MVHNNDPLSFDEPSDAAAAFAANSVTNMLLFDCVMQLLLIASSQNHNLATSSVQGLNCEELDMLSFRSLLLIQIITAAKFWLLHTAGSHSMGQ